MAAGGSMEFNSKVDKKNMRDTACVFFRLGVELVAIKQVIMIQ